MTIFFDSNLIIDFMNGKNKHIFDEVNQEEWGLTIYNYLEVQYEVKKEKKELLKEFTKNFRIFYPKNSTYYEASETIQNQTSQGKIVPLIDVLVSRIVKENQGTIYTRDKDFKNFNDINKKIIE